MKSSADEKIKNQNHEFVIKYRVGKSCSHNLLNFENS